MGLRNYLGKTFAAAIGLTVLLGVTSAFGQDDDEQRRSDRRARRQQEWSDRKSRNQQWDSDRESRRQQRNSDRESRRQQRESDRESRRQQRWSDRNSRRQQEWSDRRSRRSEGRDSSNRRWRRDRDDDEDDEDDDRRGRRNRRYERRGYDIPRRVNWNNIWNGGGRNWEYNDDRRERRREAKEYRKQQRRIERQQRRYDRGYGRNAPYYGNDAYYNDDAYGYNGGSNWKNQLLQAVIGNVLGNRLGGGDLNVLSALAPEYGNGNYNSGNYGRVPQYSYGVPYAADAYQPDYGYAPSSGNGLVQGLLGSPLVGNLIDRYTGGNGFMSEMLGNVVSQGYDRGFLSGQYARQNGYGDDYYRDPYAYQNGVYHPYSASLGQNRELLSEGYQLGYQDALQGRSEYDPQSDGNTDLVSLLLNNVLGAV